MRSSPLFLSLGLLGLGGLACLPACSWIRGDPSPNLLVVVVDSLRFDAISRSLGAPRTPHIQELCDDGVSFPLCFSHSPITLPANTALLSARLPSDSRVMNNGQELDPKLNLCAQWLAKHDYQTIAAVSIASLWPAAPGRGIDRGFAQFQMGTQEIEPASSINEALFAFLDRARTDQPWFAFAQYSEPHEPYDAHGSETHTAQVARDGKPLEQIAVSDASFWECEAVLAPGRHSFSFRSDVPLRVRRFTCTGSDGPLPVQFEKGNTKEASNEITVAIDNTEDRALSVKLAAWVHDVPDLAHTRARYKLEVEAVDRALGALIGELKRRNLYDRTIIAFTADHGEALGDHGRVGHTESLYDETLRVPLVIKPVKGDLRAAELARVQHDVVRHIDVVPTLLELLDIKGLPGTQGTSLLRGAERVLVAETHPPEASTTLYAIRDARYKMLLGSGEESWEMYDLSADTLEVENIFMLQGHLRPAWQTQLRELVGNAPQVANLRMGIKPNRKTSEELKALGY